MTNKEKLSRILEVEGMLVSKTIIEGYKPNTGDEYQPLRDEIHQLRIELGLRKR